jgi:hypothetical protein
MFARAIKRVCLAAGVLYCALPLMGSIIPVTNWGFEASTEFSGQSPFTPTQYWNLGSIPGWDVTGTWVGDFRPTAIPPTKSIDPYEGLNVAFVQSASISQQLSSSAVEGRTYTLSVAVGRRYEVQQAVSFTIQLLAGGVPIIDYTGDTGSLAPGGWQVWSLRGIATGVSGDLEIVLSGGDAALSNGGQIEFDAVHLSDSVVPEPASLILFGFGISAIGFSRLLHSKIRRKRLS